MFWLWPTNQAQQNKFLALLRDISQPQLHLQLECDYKAVAFLALSLKEAMRGTPLNTSLFCFLSLYHLSLDSKCWQQNNQQTSKCALQSASAVHSTLRVHEEQILQSRQQWDASSLHHGCHWVFAHLSLQWYWHPITVTACLPVKRLEIKSKMSHMKCFLIIQGGRKHSKYNRSSRIQGNTETFSHIQTEMNINDWCLLKILIWRSSKISHLM